MQQKTIVAQRIYSSHKYVDTKLPKSIGLMLQESEVFPANYFNNRNNWGFIIGSIEANFV